MKRGYMLLECVAMLVLLGVIMPVFSYTFLVFQKHCLTLQRQIAYALERDLVDRCIRKDLEGMVALYPSGENQWVWRHRERGQIMYTCKNNRLFRRGGSRGQYITDQLICHKISVVQTPQRMLTITMASNIVHKIVFTAP